MVFIPVGDASAIAVKNAQEGNVSRSSSQKLLWCGEYLNFTVTVTVLKQSQKSSMRWLFPPQPQQGRVSQSWCGSTVRVILHNTRYVGQVVWGRNHKVQDPTTGRRVARPREGETPIRGADAPHPRIISDELWLAVQSRQELVKALYHDSGKRAALLRSKAMNVRYLFSGILKCKTCGSNMQIISGRGRNHNNQVYGCPLNFGRGDSVCSNRARVRRGRLERQPLAGLQEKVLREEVIDYVLNRFESQLVRELKDIGGEMDCREKRASRTGTPGKEPN